MNKVTVYTTEKALLREEKNMKKLLAVVLTGAFVVSALAGCGKEHICRR